MNEKNFTVEIIQRSHIWISLNRRQAFIREESNKEVDDVSEKLVLLNKS